MAKEGRRKGLLGRFSWPRKKVQRASDQVSDPAEDDGRKTPLDSASSLALGPGQLDSAAAVAESLGQSNPSSPTCTCPGSSGSGTVPTSGSPVKRGTPTPPRPSILGRSLALGRKARCLHVQVVAARGVLAADTNGLSDPYCIVRVGHHKRSTRVDEKTLSPQWNELFVFPADAVEEAAQEGLPQVRFRVFDWDLVSADDFLGQMDVEFSELEGAGGHAEPRWVPLHLPGKGGKAKPAGEILVAVWWGEQAGAGEAGGSAHSTLCAPPGVAKRVPLVVHTARGSLYEEPLIACLAVVLEGVEAVPLHAAAAPAAGAAASQPVLAEPAAGNGTGAGGSPAAGSKLGALMPFRRKTPAAFAGGLPDRRAQSLSTASEAARGGEDGEGGEDDDLNLLFGGSSTAGLPLSLGDPEEPGFGGDSADAEQEDDGPDDSPSTAGEAGDDTDLHSGKLLYLKLTLGRQKRTSFIRRERRDGTARWHQCFVFACPLPVKNRQVSVELYRTPATTRKGRLVASTQVWLYDLMPQLLEAPSAPSAAAEAEAGAPEGAAACRTHRSSFVLQAVDKKGTGGRVLLSSAVVDQDERRAMYRTPLSEQAAAAGQKPLTGTPGSGAAQQQQHQGPDGAPHALKHLQSSTALMSERERHLRAEMTEEGYAQWSSHWTNRLAEGARAAASQQAVYLQQLAGAWTSSAAQYLGWQQPTMNDTAEALPARRQPSLGPPGSPGKDGAAAPPPQPPATLHLTLASLRLPSATADCFLVLKCGPHWGRTGALTPAGAVRDTVSVDWELSMPLHDPSTLLLVTVFSQPRRFKSRSGSSGGELPVGGTGRKGSGLIGPNVPQMVGKLRLRLSTLAPNQPVTATLPLLSERKKGAQQVGTAELSVRVEYGSTKALLRSYLRPHLPEAAYGAGVAEAGAQGAMAAETRRIVLRWLDAANPAIPRPVALAVLDTEREEFAMSRLRANLRRLQLMAAGVARFKKWWAGIERWDSPGESACVCAALVALAFRPSLVLPLLLGWAALRVAAARPAVLGSPPPMEHDPPELAPEEQELEKSHSTNPYTILMRKYEALVAIMLKVQNYTDDLGTALEKIQALASWQDPVATCIYLAALLGLALIIFLLGLNAVLAFALFWIARPPRLRTPTPPPPANLFRRLPSRADRIM